MPSENPHTRGEILRAITEVEGEVASFFGSLTDEELVLRAGEAWTPAEHLRHLCTSVGAVARGLALPKLLLRLRFGRARRPSRGYAEVRESYRAALAGGAGATGVYVPAREDVPAAGAGARRAEILARWTRVNARLRSALEGWSEAQLDRVRLPHPILGLLTTREMLFFTLYHNRHHVEAAGRRLPRFGGSEANRNAPGDDMALTLSSTAFAADGPIPARYTCEGEDLSPPLSWSGIPEGARSLALVVDDPDAPDPRNPRTTWVHWVLYNLPPSAPGLPEGTRSGDLPPGTREGLNDWRRTGYGGPCPPVGRHRYFHKLYALDAVLPDLGSPTKAELERAMEGHVLARAELVGTYQKSR